jgi:hypothetical protein
LGAILRWFYEGGTRHRAYLRHRDAAIAEQLELVIGAGQWQAAVAVAAETSLEDYSVQRLTELARELRGGGPQPVPDLRRAS